MQCRQTLLGSDYGLIDANSLEGTPDFWATDPTPTPTPNPTPNPTPTPTPTPGQARGRVLSAALSDGTVRLLDSETLQTLQVRSLVITPPTPA